MRLKLIRRYKKDTYTIGQLLVDGAFFCNTLEDKDRGLTQDMPLPVIKAAKVYGEAAALIQNPERFPVFLRIRMPERSPP